MLSVASIPVSNFPNNEFEGSSPSYDKDKSNFLAVNPFEPMWGSYDPTWVNDLEPFVGSYDPTKAMNYFLRYIFIYNKIYYLTFYLLISNYNEF